MAHFELFKSHRCPGIKKKEILHLPNMEDYRGHQEALGHQFFWGGGDTKEAGGGH